MYIQDYLYDKVGNLLEQQISHHNYYSYALLTDIQVDVSTVPAAHKPALARGNGLVGRWGPRP